MSTCIECVVPESLGLSSARLGRISVYLKDYVESGKLPGYLVVVARRGQPVYLDRYGWRDAGPCTTWSKRWESCRCWQRET